MLLALKNTIEELDKVHQIEILRRMVEHNGVTVNSNMNGTFINLSNVPAELISNIEKYIIYVNEQSNDIDQVEIQKEEYKKKFFSESTNESDEIEHTL
jgi:hypothetical protein